jgi:hypothetical protein
MSSRFPTGPFETLTQRTWFGVELIDPVTTQTVSQGVVVKLAGSVTPPIRTPSGRFGWLLPGAVFPQTVQFEDEHRRYSRREYVINPVLPLPRAALFRLPLEHMPGFAFDSDTTLLRGRIIVTRPAANADPQPVADARLWLRWRNQPANGPAVDVDGPVARGGASGHFACALPLPPGARPARLGADLVAALVIERTPAGGATQRKIFQGVTELRQSRTRLLAQPIVWDEL